MTSRHEDDDEFDDLDELLDDFADEVLSKPPGEGAKSNKQHQDDAPAVPQAQTAQTASKNEPINAEKVGVETEKSNESSNKSGATGSTNSNDPDLSIPELDEEFANKLKLGVDYLLNEMNESPEAKQEFESLMAGMASATAAGAGNSGNSNQKAQSTANTSGGGFQDTISQTMDRLKESNNDLNNNTPTPGSEEEFLAKMMKEFESMSGGGPGMGGDGMDMSGLLAEMLQELSSKDILYEPLKEMQEKYPPWLEQNGSTVPKEDLERYKEQERLVNEMCAKFEDPKYSDDDKEARKFITERMEQMQKSGSPPADLVGNLANGAIPGMDMGPDGMPALPDELENCNVQ